MTMVLAVSLIVLGFAATGYGLRTRRPALTLLGAAVLISHGLPLVLTMPTDRLGTVDAFWPDIVCMTALASPAWVLGYWVLARKPAGAFGTIRTVELDPSPWHIAVVVALVVLIGLAPGGPIGFATAGFLRLPVETPLFSLTYAFACLAALTTSLVCLRQMDNAAPTPWFSIVIVLAIFWLLGGRTQLVITGLSFALLYLAHGRIRPQKLVLPALILLGLALQTLSLRLTLQGEETGLLAALSMTMSQLSLLEGYALSARHVAEAGFHPGHYWDVLQQVMPRAMFPDKPLQLSRALRLMESRDTLGGLTTGLVGEAFTAGGQLGICIVGLLFGGILALLDNAYGALERLGPLHQAMVVSLIPILAIFVLRGGFDTAIFRLATMVAGWMVLALSASRAGIHGVSR